MKKVTKEELRTIIKETLDDKDKAGGNSDIERIIMILEKVSLLLAEESDRRRNVTAHNARILVAKALGYLDALKSRFI